MIIFIRKKHKAIDDESIIVENEQYKQKIDFIVNSKNEISSIMSRRRLKLFRNHFRAISRVNRLSKFNDRDENLKVIRFLTQFGSNMHHRTQSFITMINLNDTNRHVVYLIHIMLIICWLNLLRSGLHRSTSRSLTDQARSMNRFIWDRWSRQSWHLLTIDFVEQIDLLRYIYVALYHRK